MSSWAKVATGMKPNPLREDINNESPSTPSSVPTILTPAAALAAAHSGVLVDHEIVQSAHSAFTDMTTSRAESDPGSALSPLPASSQTEELVATTTSFPKGEASDIANTINSSTPASITTTTIAIDEMANTKRMEKQAAKAAAAATAAEAIESPAGSSFAAPSSATEDTQKQKSKRKKKKTKKQKKKDSKGKGIALNSSVEESDVSSTEAEAATAAAADQKKEEADKKALERDRRRKLFGAKHGHDLTIILGKDRTSIKVHRDIIVAESKWMADRLPPADKNGMTTFHLPDWTSNMMGPICTFLYTDVMPGLNVNREKKWDLRFVLFNVMTYRSAASLEIKSAVNHVLSNIKEASDYYGPLLSGRFYHFKFSKPGSVENLEIPFRMAYICLYQEASHPDEMREMKAHLAKLFVAILPFIRRQPAYKDHISGFWSNLPFPWREDMRAFYDEGLLNEYAQIFDTKGNWIEEEHGEEQTEPQNLSAPGPSSGAPPFYGASVDEMTRRMRDANVRDF